MVAVEVDKVRSTMPRIRTASNHTNSVIAGT
jgi:hypothetical protein